MDHDAVQRYWKKNVRLKVTLLTIWGLTSLVLAIGLAQPLNGVVVGGFPLGFWMAQQGAIYVFVALIFIYAKRMDTMDGELEAELRAGQGGRS